MRRAATLGVLHISLLVCWTVSRASAQDPQLVPSASSSLLPDWKAPRSRTALPIVLGNDFADSAGQEPDSGSHLRTGTTVPGAVTIAEPNSEAPSVDYCSCKHPWEIFHRKQIELQVMSGITYFPIGLGPNGPDMILLPQSIRFGYMLNDVRPDRLIRGTWEPILELDTIPIVEGPGSILAGGALYLRYNLSCRDLRLIPYFEIGGGGSYTDAYKFHPTNVSTGFEFILHLSHGVHFLINSRWALSAEVAFYHFSNSGMNVHNLGINTWGTLLGVSHFFR
jgi:hypothetical protein